MKQKILLLILFCFTSTAFGLQMAPDRMSDIRNTKHNFAASDTVILPGGDTRDVKAASENQVCIFCHTPHGDPNISKGQRPFLWNKTLENSNYERYSSSSMDLVEGVLGQGSKMCLSCHDGTVAIGQLEVINGRLGSDVGDVAMIDDTFATSKSNLGMDLSNDHPIGFLYNSSLVIADRELIDPASTEGAHIGVPVGSGVAQNNEILVSDGATAGANQPTTTTGGGISVPLESVISGLGSRDIDNNITRTLISAPGTGSVECTTCHDPHIRSSDNSVNIKFLRLRRFQKTAGPIAGSGFKIENDINCLACHKKTGWDDSVHANADTATQVYDETAADEREFPREIQMWEASCLNCHAPHTVSNARWLLTQNASTLAGSEASDVDRSCYKCHTADSPAVQSGAAVIDRDALMGGHAGFAFTAGDTAHRPGSLDDDPTVDFLAESSESLQARHVVCSDCHSPHGMQKGLHTNTNANPDDNNAVSGVLTGVAGLNASDNTGVFNPYGNEDTATPVIATKEHQICFKCHSTYGHRADNINIGVGKFSNTVMEFSNTTSAHPVVTGTTNVGLAVGLMVEPFNTNTDIGLQTMYCSDCHTNTDGNGTPVSPAGSHNDDVAACETCHVAEQYNSSNGAAIVDSGFACLTGVDCGAGTSNNLHVFHAEQSGTGHNICSNCHVKVVHGWKNKALLANINEADSDDVRYYGIVTDIAGAKSKIDTMSPSGQWEKVSCGTAGGCH